MSTNIEKNINIDDWITQSEAARLRKVTRQAINKLVKLGRIRTVNVGGLILVSRIDAENFEAKNSGRPKKK